MQSPSRIAVVLTLTGLYLALIGVSKASTISQPPFSLPVQSYSDDPALTGSSASAALCSLRSILGTESAHGIGPLTIQPDCMSMTLQPHSTASINGQTLPSSGIATIFGSSSSASAASSQPTTPPSASTSQSSSPPTSSAAPSFSSSVASQQSNAANSQHKQPAAASWIARQNIVVLLFTTFALLAAVTYFLDELLGLLV